MKAKRKPAKHFVNRQYFKQLLEDRDMSQRTLAKHMDMDQSSLVRAFQGKRAFKLRETEQMAHILNVPHRDILANLGVGKEPDSRLAWAEVLAKNAYMRSALREFLSEVEWVNDLNRKKSGHLVSEDHIKRAKHAILPPTNEAVALGFGRKP